MLVCQLSLAYKPLRLPEIIPVNMYHANRSGVPIPNVAVLQVDHWHKPVQRFKEDNPIQ
jgi:hypothetical protein